MLISSYYFITYNTCLDLRLKLESYDLQKNTYISDCSRTCNYWKKKVFKYFLESLWKNLWIVTSICRFWFLVSLIIIHPYSCISHWGKYSFFVPKFQFKQKWNFASVCTIKNVTNMTWAPKKVFIPQV